MMIWLVGNTENIVCKGGEMSQFGLLRIAQKCMQSRMYFPRK